MKTFTVRVDIIASYQFDDIKANNEKQAKIKAFELTNNEMDNGNIDYDFEAEARENK